MKHSLTIESEISFSKELLHVFILSREEAVKRGSETIGPEHLLLGLFKAMVDGKISGPMRALTSPGEAYTQFRTALNDYWRSQNVPVLGEPMLEPLVEAENKVRATSRLVRTIKRALTRTQLSGDMTCRLPHLILALIEEARMSEVAFINNRVSAIALAESQIASEQSESAPTETKQSRAPELLFLETTTRRAAEHAKRLNSKRLDINHLGLALLEENDDAILTMLEAFGGVKSRIAVRHRLELCLLYQRYQSPYQKEPGEILDLTKISELLA